MSVGKNSALKTGLLFPGCIYARIGDVQESREFILAFKASIESISDTIAGFWQRLQQFVETYPFSKWHGHHFQLLLSTRVSGEPTFHRLDSLLGLSLDRIDHENYILGFGSGSDVLTPYITDLFTPRLQNLQNRLVAEQQLPLHIIRRITPYFLCLWLSELSLTSEVSLLERHGVGGAFHFCYQTNDQESYQGPSIYIFCGADYQKHVIYGWSYKVACLQGGLYIERHIPPNQGSMSVYGTLIRDAFFDDAARPDVVSITQQDLQSQIEKGLAETPFYEFCGFGFTDPSYRNSFGFLFSSTGKREDIFDKDGRLQPDLQRLIASNFGT